LWAGTCFCHLPHFADHQTNPSPPNLQPYNSPTTGTIQNNMAHRPHNHIHEYPPLQHHYLVHKENPGGEPGLSSTRYNRYNLFV